jgi:biopolymer transport protein ExbB/TolQ
VSKIRDADMLDVRLEKLIQDYEFDVERHLERLKIAVRVGPILGLMGTLIPLGPALIGLTSGDIEVLAKNLTVAFTTTVAGLFVGAVSYTIFTLRRRWYAQDLSDVAFYAEMMAGRRNGEE